MHVSNLLIMVCQRSKYLYADWRARYEYGLVKSEVWGPEVSASLVTRQEQPWSFPEIQFSLHHAEVRARDALHWEHSLCLESCLLLNFDSSLSLAKSTAEGCWPHCLP